MLVYPKCSQLQGVFNLVLEGAHSKYKGVPVVLISGLNLFKCAVLLGQRTVGVAASLAHSGRFPFGDDMYG